MELSEEGIIINLKPFSGNKHVISILTEEHGKWKGIVPCTISLNIGDLTTFTWKSRSPDGLGSFFFNNIQSNFILHSQSRLKLSIIKSICDLCTICLTERESCVELFHFLKEHLTDITIEDYVLFEIKLLDTLGCPLDFSKCSVSGTQNVYYMSPKTGRSVCKEVGEKYKDKLFIIPKIFLSNFNTTSNKDIVNALNLIEYFLRKNTVLQNTKILFRDKIKEIVVNGQ